MNEAVLDSGPIIHLEQIDYLEVLELIDKIYLTEEVENEVGGEIIEELDAEKFDLKPESKDKAKYLSNRDNIELGESTAIALCQQENIEIIFTDDLDARQTAKRLDLEPHGTLAIVTRAYSENIIEKQEAKKIVEKLRKDSTLFLTADLVKWAKRNMDEN